MGTSATPDTVTHEGASAYSYDDKTALFVLGAGRFFGEDSFYETAQEGTRRYIDLVRRVAVGDPEWFKGFVRWLRHDANIRTAAIVAAAEGAAAWQKAKIPGTRDLVASVIVRADEVGEFLAYYRTNVKRVLGGGVRRALKDRINGLSEAGVLGLYTERNAIKWDGSNNAYRFADALELITPKPRDARQDVLFKYLLDERHHGDGDVAGLPMISAYKEMQHRLRVDRTSVLRDAIADPSTLRYAGMTWENLSSSGPMSKEAWEAIIPSMGYMALLRNLRNFDEAGISNEMKEYVARKLADPNEVAKSRQLPFRFMSAYENAMGAKWQASLEEALRLSTRNIPELDGLTVVTVDTSASMDSGLSGKSKMTYVKAAALFGAALAVRQEAAELWGFANGTNIFQQRVAKDASILRVTEEFRGKIGRDGHGTRVDLAVQHALQRNANRIVVISDMQCMNGTYLRSLVFSSAVPVPIYAFNMAGYGQTVIDTNATQHQLSGLSDATFSLIKTIEDGQRGQWPWMK